MPITWNEARELNTKLLAQRARDDLMTRFPVGSKARITRMFYEDRAWGDTVTITDYCPFDGIPGVCADHEDYGDVGWTFAADELEPIASSEQVL